MIDIFGKPQNVLVVGGTSEIALDVIKRLNTSKRLMNLYLTGRDLNSLKKVSDSFQNEYTNVTNILLDHDKSNSTLIELINRIDIDVVIMASGYLPNSEDQLNPDEVRKVINRNYSAIVEIGSVLVKKFILQGFGVLILFSSVAAMRPRPDNFLYGSSKAGLDNWARGAMYKLKNSGAKILLVRTGMVETKMSKHLPKAPITISTGDVAREISKNIKGKKQIIWIPNKIKLLVLVLKFLPSSIIIKIANKR